MNYSHTCTTVVLLLLCVGTLPLSAQQRILEKTLPAPSGENIQLNLKFGERIVVKGWDREEVSFRAVVEINEGRLNDAFVADFTDDGRGIRIETDLDHEKLREGRTDECDCNHSVSFSRNNGGMVCTSITYEIHLPKDGRLAIETISADVELNDVAGPIDVQSVSGFVDLSWPENRSADISLKTVTGEAYTNLGNLTISNRKERMPHVGYELRGTIGSGGPVVRLESVSGNLFLRKPG